MKHQPVHLEDVLSLCDSGEWGDDPVSGEGIPVLRVSDVKAGNQISFATAPIRSLSAQKRTAKTLKNGDIVVVKSSGSATNVVSGRASLVSGVEDNQYGFANFLLRLRADERRYNPHFLIHILGSPQVRDYVLSMVSGSTYPNLRVPEYKRILIPNPPLAEQQRIVGLLDEAFAGLATAQAHAEKNHQNARALFESHLQSVFTRRGKGWVEKRLGEMCERITKGSSPKWQGIAYVDKPGILFVTSENVGEYQILLGQPKYVEEKFNAKDKKSILKPGDVLTNIVGASIGRTAVFDRDDVANINQAVCLIRCEPDRLNNSFLTYLLNSPVFRHVLHDNEVDNARANLSLGFFSQLLVPTPPLSEQRKIVSALDSLREETQRLASLYERKLAALEALKKSLLHRAFNGELTKDNGQ